jgi:hypothetical protein
MLRRERTLRARLNLPQGLIERTEKSNQPRPRAPRVSPLRPGKPKPPEHPRVPQVSPLRPGRPLASKRSKRP